MRKTVYILPLVVIAFVVLLSSIFIVDEREKALVLQFGQIKRVKEEPGLALKIPLIQEVVRYDDRILSLDTEPFEVTPSDDRRLVVDAFARYRISDVVRFRQAVGVGGLRAAEARLEGILNPQIRAVLGSDGVTSNTILSEDRAGLMDRITQQARQRAEDLGLYVLDVRLKQTNLPEQNLDATFARMRAEREREAADEIARGEEAAQRVRALADRTVVELVSDARRESEIVRGEADARRNGIFAEAFGRDEEFFEFYRSLAAYEQALKAGNSTLVINPDSEFFDYLKNDQPRAGGLTGMRPATAPDATSDGVLETGEAGDAAAGEETGAAAGGTGAAGGDVLPDAGSGATATPAPADSPAGDVASDPAEPDGAADR